MKSKLFLMAALLLCGSMSLAQQQRTVTGTVTDNKGMPIPGARVELVGCNESVLTELDGSFLITTECPAKQVLVQYGGMQQRKANIKPDMRVKLRKSSWWTDRPERYRWFVTAQVAFPWQNAKDPAFGAMVGVVKEFGIYAKALYRPLPSSEGRLYYLDSDDWTTGDNKSGYMAFGGGLIKRLWCPIHFYVGGGYNKRRNAIGIAGVDEKMGYEPDYSCGGYVEAGFMLHIKHFIISGGAQIDLSINKIVADAGIGVNF